MAAPMEQSATGGALERRAGKVINHDVVRGFDTATSDDYCGRSFKLFQPLLLSTSDSCYSYPAVNPNGDCSGGLQIGGSQTGDCRDSAGQTYVRGYWWNKKYAIMYAWYFPKDQNFIKIKGHRHDWEHVVVWINNPDDRRFKPELLGVSTSSHSGYKKYVPAPGYDVEDWTHPRVKYFPDVAVFGTHGLDLTSDDGGMSRLIQWELMTPAAQDSLNHVNWGDANFPMGGNFEGNLAKAWPF
ncbi:NPP1 domain protein [Colletotrichum tofieldiae]|nr:NPP1 domain protein [Colletotrichum tofieldiae]GKT72551.1 NPP1 domain protein [Colletotrichum tofieldiae]